MLLLQRLLVYASFVFLACHGLEEQESNNDDASSQYYNHYYYSNPSDDFQTIRTGKNVNETEYFKWEADDPYFYLPSDDKVLYQLRKNSFNAKNENVGNNTSGAKDPMQLALAGCLMIVGFSSAIFCTAVALYYLEVDSLMRRYTNEGKVVDSIVIGSSPNVLEVLGRRNEPEQGSLATANSAFSDDDKPARIGRLFEEKGENLENDTMMTEDVDDMSYQQYNRGVVNGSYDSESVQVPVGNFRGAHTSNQRDDYNFHQFLRGKRDISFAIPRKVSHYQQWHENDKFHSHRFGPREKPNSKQKQIYPAKRFRVIVEYEEIGQRNNISPFKKIRKLAHVREEDLHIKPKNKEDSRPQVCVKLYVIPNRPMSGHPCGEVRRALQCQNFFAFCMYLLLGLSFVAGGIVAAYFMLPMAFLCIYVVLLLAQMPALSSFLSRSFSQIMTAEFLEKGALISMEDDGKETLDEKQMFAALGPNGSIFGDFEPYKHPI